MNTSHEITLAKAKRHVVEGEQRVTRQRAIIVEMDRDDHPNAAIVARELLGTLDTSLDLMREHLKIGRDQVKGKDRDG
jgi:hypothetical protein